jgi:hypothetical protein
MKYLIFGMAALLACQCALAQTAAPATPPGEPAKKDTVTQPAPVKGAAAAKSVGPKDMTIKADAYLKSQERKKAAMARKREAKGGEPKNKTKTASADDSVVGAGTMMTDDERTAHRKKLQSFKTLAECETYEKQHRAEMETRAKAQNKTLREATGVACNRYKVAAGAAAPTAAAAPAAGKAAPK